MGKKSLWNSEQVNEEIIQLCREIIDKGLKMEIKATIVETLAGKYTTNEIEKYVDHFMNDKSDIPTDILNIGIGISYDMG